MIPTAEVVLTNLVRKSVVRKINYLKDLSIHTMFRKEAGSYGKDTKG